MVGPGRLRRPQLLAEGSGPLALGGDSHDRLTVVEPKFVEAGVDLGQLRGPVGLHRLEGVTQGLPAQRAVAGAGERGRALDGLAGPLALGPCRFDGGLDGGQCHLGHLRLGTGRFARGLVGRHRDRRDRDGVERGLGRHHRLDQAETGLRCLPALGIGCEHLELLTRLLETRLLLGQLGHPRGGLVVLFAHRPALSHQPVVLLAQDIELVVPESGGAGIGPAHDGQRLVVGHALVGCDRSRLGRSQGHADRAEVGEHGAEAFELLLGQAGVLASQVARRVERGDAEQLQDEAPALGRRLLAECGELLLLGEHRGPESAVIHAQDGVDVAAGIAHALGHLLTVGMGLGLDLGVCAADRPPHHVEMTLVLELQLGDALGVDTGGAHFVHCRTGAPVEDEPDALDERALARPVQPVDTDQPRRDLELELVLEHPVVPEQQPGDAHQSAASSTARRQVLVAPFSDAVAIEADQILTVDVIGPLDRERGQVGKLDVGPGAGEVGLELQVQGVRRGGPDRLEIEHAIGLGVDPLQEQPDDGAGRYARDAFEHPLLYLGRRQAEGVDGGQREQGTLASERNMDDLACISVEDHDALGGVGVVGIGEGVGGAGVPDAGVDLGMEVVVTEQRQVGRRLEQAGVDLDLVDVGVVGLHLRHPGMGEQQVGGIGVCGSAEPRPALRGWRRP